jgi:8-oxo-dGTP diphosphatase
MQKGGLLDRPYVLSVKALVLDEQGRCLLLRRAAGSRTDPGLWDLVGGKYDGPETLQQAIEREAMEETGLEIRIVGFLGAEHVERDLWHVVHVFLEARVAGGGFRLGDEHDDARWVGPEDLDRLELCPGFRAVLERTIRA